ncbi:MAG TPA: peptide deformylase [Micrococcales bacterium]|uniref:Peptide deformylase n=1 Tax=Miniimonas arenae TaxID=676201 RepID=A0A5C5BBL3_9MICO|nr:MULTISPECIES: peptide deformylase [Miniimonas]TNU73932.1 peptide deformylase [Miniimonas arenae]HCX84493.1 peptide deformylase [Micrococcales bacterium]
MAILPIVVSGDPVLHTPAAPVGEITDELRTLVADMVETMDAAPGVGLAAPQVGVGLRLFTYAYVDDSDRPWRGVVINPELWMTPPAPGEPDEEEEAEGCLSFPGERFPLRRSDHVVVTGTDLEGADVRLEVTGWRARILQHEFDHLDGVLYTDRLTRKERQICQKISKKRGWGVPGVSWTPGVDEVGEG